MINKDCYDLAISYSSVDSWIAKDIYQLVTNYGYYVYCAEVNPDKAYGFLREQLHNIYNKSRLNLIIWSNSYANKPQDSVVEMEEGFIWYRHIGKREPKTLFILTIDNTPPNNMFESVLIHKLHQVGVVGTVNHIISRLKEISPSQLALGSICHPLGTESNRGELVPCYFSIEPNFQNDHLGRWRRLADIEVKLVGENILPNTHVYLIPSGGTTLMQRHSLMLKTNPILLEKKRNASLIFTNQNLGQILKGFMFHSKKKDFILTSVYSLEYDQLLNQHFLKEITT